jgi:hypothetical protein
VKSLLLIFFFWMNQNLYKPNTKESHLKVQANHRAKRTNNPQALPQSNKLHNSQKTRPKTSRPQTKPLNKYNLKTAELRALNHVSSCDIHYLMIYFMHSRKM